MKNKKYIYIGAISLVFIALIMTLVQFTGKSKTVDSSSNNLGNESLTEIATEETIAEEALTDEASPSISFKQTDKPEYIKDIEETIQVNNEIEKLADGSIKITGKLLNTENLKEEEILSHFTQKLRLTDLIALNDIKIDVIKGESFPNDQLRTGTFGAFDKARTTLQVTIINMDIDNSETSPLPIYELTFKPETDLSEIEFIQTEIKVDSYIVEIEDSKEAI
jgi:hypothetical protein